VPPTLDGDLAREALDANLPALAQWDPKEASRVRAFFERALPASQARLDTLDLPLDGAVFRALGLMLGAGIVVYGESAEAPLSVREQALNCLEFFHRESCGKCVPCRLGCEQLVEIARGRHDGPVRETIADLAEVMEVTSLCSLGRVASRPLTSLLDHFPAEAADLGRPTGP
jgi:NADH:ubiquinone oxidoreductase subunit F (NADH-binding)